MRRPSLPLVWAVSFAVLLASISGCRQSPSPAEKSEAKEATATEDHDAQTGVRLETQKQERMGLEVQTLATAASRAEVELHGVLDSDPSETFVLRAPFSGVLDDQLRSWPVLGSQIADGSTVASIVPQLPAADRLTITDRLSTIRADIASSAASLDAAKAEYQRLKTLNSEDKNVADRTVEEAEARLKGEQARLESAHRSQDLLESALHLSGKNAAAMPLVAERGGQVAEVLAQPGESIEAGQPIFRISRFDKLIAKLSLPISQEIQLPIKSATISAVGEEQKATIATFIARAPTTQPEYQSQTLLFRVESSSSGLRPGQAVEGWVATKAGSSQSGVVIPFRSVVHYQGQNWIYVQIKPEQFARRPIPLSEPQGRGWFVSQGVKAGDRVVVSGAQTLLSEELKSQLSADED